MRLASSAIVFAVVVTAAALAHADVHSPPAGEPPPALELEPEERELLLRGEIGPGAHIGGVALAWFVGLGTGQAVQGRYLDRGWIFTLGEASTGLLVASTFGPCVFGDSPNTNTTACGLFFAGAAGLTVFRAWSLADAIVAPMSHNRRVRALHHDPGLRGAAPSPPRLTGFALPTRRGALGGLTLRF